jgi:hypothetical protein
VYGVLRGQKQILVVDGQEGVEYDKINGLVFSPDGKRVAYMALDGQRQLMVVDGHAGEGYAQVAVPVFSPNGKHVAYSAKKGEHMLEVIDGQESAEYESVGGPIFSPDSKHVAFGAKKSHKKIMAVVDGQEGAEYDSVAGLTFSPDGVLTFLVVKEGSLYRVNYTPQSLGVGSLADPLVATTSSPSTSSAEALAAAADRDLEKDDWNHAEEAGTATAWLKFYRAHPQSTRITVVTGTVRADIGGGWGGNGGSWGGNGVSVSQSVFVEIDGVNAGVTMSVQDASTIGILRNEPVAGGIAAVAGKTTPNAKVIRSKNTGKLLTVDTGGR